MLPLATTTVTVKRVIETEPGETQTAVAVASKVNAHIGSEGGTRVVAPGGGKIVYDWRLDCDPFNYDDRERYLVIDDQTGDTYQLEWAALRPGLGLDHIEGGMNRVRGQAA